MDDDALNMSIRKFLKMVGVSSQREIEHAVARAIEARSVAGTETLPALRPETSWPSCWAATSSSWT